MATYLLGTHALAELTSRTGPVKQWADGLRTTVDTLYASVISLGQIQGEINAMDGANSKRQVWQRHFNATVAHFEPNYIIDVDAFIAIRWADLLPLQLLMLDVDSTPVDVPADARLVVATALERSHIFVEAFQPYHSELAPHGLKCFDPFTGRSHP